MRNIGHLISQKTYEGVPPLQINDSILQYHVYLHVHVHTVNKVCCLVHDIDFHVSFECWYSIIYLTLSNWEYLTYFWIWKDEIRTDQLSQQVRKYRQHKLKTYISYDVLTNIHQLCKDTIKTVYNFRLFASLYYHKLSSWQKMYFAEMS